MVAPSDSWIPGYRFKDGRLLIFEPERITLIKAWPEPEAARKIGSGGWQTIRPDFRLVRPYRRRTRKPTPAVRQQLLPLDLPPAAPTRSELAEQKRRAFDALRFSLPREFARAVERFQCGQFAMMQLFRATQAFLDLIVSSPLLAFQLADEAGRRRAVDDACRLLLRKQTEVAECLGFPATAATARVLRKAVPESISPHSADQLRDALRDDEAQRRLSHLRRINAGVLRLLGDERLRAAVTPTLLEEVAHSAREKYRAETADLLQDVLALERELRGSGRVPTFTSIERVRAAHREIGEEYVASKESGILDCRFPPPPVRGTDVIVALTEPRDLIVEGLRQHNCVASYAHAVARGDTYIYRVLHPERATLAIRRQSAGRWYVSELRAACNADVRRATERAVQDWLDERIVSA